MRTRSGGASPASPANSQVGLRRSNRQATQSRQLIPAIAGGVTRSTAAGSTAQALDAHSPVSVRQSPRSDRKRPASQNSAAGLRRPPKRACHQSRNYVEYSTEEEDDEADAEWETPNDPSASQSNLLNVDHQTPTPRTRTNKALEKRTPKSLKVQTAGLGSTRRYVKPDGDTATNSKDVAKGVIPDWKQLPTLIWEQIFEYAAIMLNKDDRDRAQWLVAASTTCRTLSEPALKELYRAPPLAMRSMAHGLTALLSKDPATTLHPYRPWIRTLDIDVYDIASKTYQGEPLNYDALVGHLPMLKYIGFYHFKDQPEFRQMDHNLRWTYPDELFRALEVANPRLSRWTWNRRFLSSDMMDFAQVKSIHLSKPFSFLQRLDLINFQSPSVLAPPRARADSDELAQLTQRDRQFVQQIADAISALPFLEHLSIGYSTIVNSELLSLLPKTLTSLTLFKCWEVEDNGFADYLLSHGYQLRHLTLHHNPCLSLSFVTILKAACPKLQTLSMDFKTYDQREWEYREGPYYDSILNPHQVPHWPDSLEKLELKNMKNWSVESAQVFFQSLVDSAPRLLRLREIYMKIMLDVSIGQRSEFRNKWVPILKKIFLRHQTDPLPRYSLRPDVLRPTDGVLVTKVSPSKKKKNRKLWAETESPVRMSSRILAAAAAAANQADFSESSNHSSRASSVVRDLRTGVSRPSYAEPDTDDEDLLPDDDNDQPSSDPAEDGGQKTHEEEQQPLFRHGMCEKVEIMIDNQKPAEQQYQMADFQDLQDGSGEDDASDEDWNGADRDDDEDQLAWD